MLTILKNKFLCWRYPFYKFINRDGKVDYSTTWYDLIPYGWRKAFGRQFSRELKRTLIKENLLTNFTFTDIKEKYGTLRIYCSKYSEAIDKLLNKYELLSIDYCINCGRPTVVQSGYYTLCNHCNQRNKMNSKAPIDEFIMLSTEEFTSGMLTKDLIKLIEQKRPWQKVTAIRSVELQAYNSVEVKYNRHVKRKYRG